MPGHLNLKQRVQLAARYKDCGSVVQVQRWWRTIEGRHAQVDAKTIKNCHATLIATVYDTRRRGRPINSRDPEVVQVALEMFTHSPKKSTRQTGRESGLYFHCVPITLGVSCEEVS